MQQCRVERTSVDGSVTVVVGPGGALLDLHLTRAATRRAGADLAREVCRAVAEAHRGADASVAGAVPPDWTLRRQVPSAPPHPAPGESAAADREAHARAVRELTARGVDLEGWTASADQLRARWLDVPDVPGPRTEPPIEPTGSTPADDDRLTWGSSPDGRVRARVTPSGVLHELTIHDRAPADGPAAVAAGIRHAVLAACRTAAGRVREDLAQAPGHRLDVQALLDHLTQAESEACGGGGSQPEESGAWRRAPGAAS